MFKLYLFAIVAALCLNLHAQISVQKQLKPYIVLSGPVRMNEARVNIENYTPNSKNFSRSEISFGDGSAVSTLKDAYHTYVANGSFAITVKTWDTANALTIYSEVVDVNPAFQIQDVANSTVLNVLKVQEAKPETLTINDLQATKLYKLTLTKTSVPRVRRTFPPCRSVGSNVSINGIAVFKTGEFSCAIAQMQKFVVLSKSNTVQFETSESTAAYEFSIEVHEVTILKDISPPLQSTTALSNTLTRNNLIHISVADASPTTTYVWNNQQQLVLTTVEKEFDVTLAEGFNNFVLQSIDSYGVTSTYLYLSNIRLDTTPPVINAILASEYIYNTYPQTVTISINSDEDLQALTINNVTATMLTPRAFSYLATVNQPGVLNLSIKAFDLAGNETIKSYDPVFNVENTPPVISSSLATGSFTNQNDLLITVADNSETVSEVFLNGTLVITTSLKSFNVSMVAGLNQFLIKSKDIYNNEALNLNLAVTFDNLAPILTNNIQPTYYISSIPAQVQIKITSNEALQLFEFENQPVNPVNGQYALSMSVLQNGIKNFSVSAVDLAGNVTLSNFSFNAIFDNSAPLIGVNVPDKSFSNSNLFPIVVSIEDLTAVSTQIYLNQTLVNTSALKSFNYSAPLPADGTYTIEFKASDLAGNIASKTVSVTKDSQVLTLEILSPQAGEIFASQLIGVQFRTNKAIKNAFVNGIKVPVSADMKSVIFDYSNWDARVFTIMVRVEDQYGDVIERTIQGEIKLGAATAWNYAECPVE